MTSYSSIRGVTLLWVLSSISIVYSGHICHVCNDIPRPADCPYVKECGAHETCATESYLSPGGQLLYKLGCKDTKQCGGFDINSVHIPVCSECCFGDLCGASSCGNTGYPNGTGPICFNCIYRMDKPSHCGKIKVCSRDEFCGVQKFDSGLYEVKCLTSVSCKSPEPHTECTSCCKDRVCNKDCKLASDCQDISLCPTLKATVPNLCSLPDLAPQCNGTCLCGGMANGIPGPNATITTPSTTPQTTPSTVPQTSPLTTLLTKPQTTKTPSTTPKTTPPTTPTTTASTTPTTTTTVKTTPSKVYHFPNGSICDDAPSCPFVQRTPNFCSEPTLMVYCFKTCGLCDLYSGSASGTVQDACAANNCQHGQCQPHAPGYVCNCDLGYMGALCEHRNPCYNQPCLHGQCEVLTSNGYQCRCDLGFSGPSCNMSVVRDCQDILDYNIPSQTRDDVYLIDITQSIVTSKKLNVKCEFSNTIGWTVIMSRDSGQLDFDNKRSSDYAVGFGDIRQEFWTGLEYLHAMTSDGRQYQLRIDFTVANGSRYYQVYNDFSVGPHTKFQLNVGSSYGNAGDSLSGHNTFGFTTKDLDQDSNSAQNCANYISGGWWFHNCADSCLTCNYITPGTKDCRSMSWQQLGYCIALRAVAMKIRPV